MRKYTKGLRYRAWRKRWLKTSAGKLYRARAAMVHYWKNRKWIDAYKLKRGCKFCGFRKWAEALDFDHKDRSTKKFNISQSLRLYKKRLLKEIKKCWVLCANCHRHRTKETAPHGFNV
jgi:hypothetical protein